MYINAESRLEQIKHGLKLISPNHSVSEVVGFIKGKSAIAIPEK